MIEQLATRLVALTIRSYNGIVTRLLPAPAETSDVEIAAIRQRATVGTDISSHLETVYLEGVRANPKLIVELGVRSGESTFVLEKVASKCGAVLVSVDISDCSGTCSYRQWYFVQEDDVAFGQRFPLWCNEKGLQPVVDLLLIDTSHLYDQTLAEIRTWFPHLSNTGVVILHDTNLRGIYRRHDYTIGRAWHNDRGVIRALEEFLGKALDESRAFEHEFGGWRLSHDPVCNGLTVLRRKHADPSPG